MSCQKGNLRFTPVFNGGVANSYLYGGSLSNSYLFDGALSSSSLFDGAMSGAARFIGQLESVCKSAVSPIVNICELALSRFTYANKIYGGAGGNLLSFGFSPDGMYMCVGEPLNRKISSFQATGSGWEIDEFSLFGQYDILDGGDNLANIDGIRYADDGNQLWISAHEGLIPGSFISYTLPIPYLFRDQPGDRPVRIDSASANGDGSINNTSDINIKPDGTVLIGTGNDQNPYQYNMSPLDISTLAYSEKSNAATTTSSFIPPSGTCIYTGSTSVINKYALGTPWSASTLGATPQDSLDVSAQTSVIGGIFMTEDRLFVLGTDTIYQYNATGPVLNDAWATETDGRWKTESDGDWLLEG
jgi:hypothetical protein